MKLAGWTTIELQWASRLWKQGKTLTEIADTLGRGRESVKHQCEARRDLFPRRREKRDGFSNVGKLISLKVPITPFMHKAVKAEARRRGVSQNIVIREALRAVLLRKSHG